MFITIDPYYNNQFYNESKEALKNNNVQFNEFLSIKAPFNWYLNLENAPVIVNYDKAASSESRWLVNIIKPLKPTEEYLLLRRENDKGQSSLLKFIENKPLKEARESDYAVFFTIKNKEEGIKLTKDFPGKIWYFGKYYNNKFRVCLGTHQVLKGFLNKDQILLERSTDLSEAGRFEAELNFKVFREKDRLIKFTDTPFFYKGVYKPVKIKGELSSRFIL